MTNGTRRRWGVSVTPWPLFTLGKNPVPIMQEAGWAPWPVWTSCGKSRPPSGFDPRTFQPVARHYTDWATYCKIFYVNLIVFVLGSSVILFNYTFLTFILLMWRIGRAPNSITIYIQQDATLHRLFISGNCSTCSVWYFHPSSGVRHPQHTQTSFNSSTIAVDSSNRVTNTRCCRYSCIRSWCWVEVPHETCRGVSRYK
jgi:hypothetical protein